MPTVFVTTVLNVHGKKICTIGGSMNNKRKPAWCIPLIIAIIFSILTVLDCIISSQKYLSFETKVAGVAWIVFVITLFVEIIGKGQRKKSDFKRNLYMKTDLVNKSNMIGVDTNIVRGHKMEENTIEIWDENAFSVGRKASYENGQVFCHFYHTGPSLIGYYAIEEKRPDVIVRNLRHNVIGYINFYNGKPALLWFSKEEIARWRGINRGSGPLTMIAGEFYNFSKENGTAYIQDHLTADVLAEYCGDPIGAGAAFICMYYEVSDSGEYHDFLRG